MSYKGEVMRTHYRPCPPGARMARLFRPTVGISSTAAMHPHHRRIVRASPLAVSTTLIYSAAGSVRRGSQTRNSNNKNPVTASPSLRRRPCDLG